MLSAFFQTYYETNPYWKASPSNISWIGSIQAFLLLLVGVFTGPVYDAGYFRHLIITGAILIPLGFMMTSLAREYWQVMLAQAFTIGPRQWLHIRTLGRYPSSIFHHQESSCQWSSSFRIKHRRCDLSYCVQTAFTTNWILLGCPSHGLHITWNCLVQCDGYEASVPAQRS